jgi:hypothetical protein
MRLIDNKKDIIHDGVMESFHHVSEDLYHSDYDIYDNQCVDTYVSTTSSITIYKIYDDINR